MSLLGFRHAKVELAGICYGQLDIAAELPDAEAAAIIQKQLGMLAIDRIWSSPLVRCAGPARVLAQQRGVPHVIDVRLCELAYGTWEGRAWEEIERSNSLAYASWMTNWKTSGPPGGESALDLEQRVRAWWTELSMDTGQLLLAHAGVLRALKVITQHMLWEDAMTVPIAHLQKELIREEGS